MHQFAGQTPEDKIKFLFKVYDIDGLLQDQPFLQFDSGTDTDLQKVKIRGSGEKQKTDDDDDGDVDVDDDDDSVQAMG